jgi:hypothetical protein
MKVLGGIATAVLVFTLVLGTTRMVTPAVAQDSRTAWLEGTVLDENGNPCDGSMTVSVIAPDGRTLGVKMPDANTGGLYSFHDIQPGTYEVRLARNTDHSRAPQRVFGVVLLSGQRTILNFVTKPGDGVIETGHPVVVTQPVIVVSQELARLQARIDELEKELASLKRSGQ